MDKLDKRLSAIAYIINRQQRQKNSLIHKTALMKTLFMFQEIYKADLGYDFQIYLYGPYASEVSSDLFYLENCNAIKVETAFASNYSYNNLKISSEIDKLLAAFDESFSDEQKTQLNQLVDKFVSLKVSELELVSTIVYVNYRLRENKSFEIQKVRDIKPHFSLKEVESKYDELCELEMLNKLNN